MSLLLFKFSERFVGGWISAQSFSDAYVQLWKIERDCDLLRKGFPGLDECLSTIFCLADMYEPDEAARESYEFGDEDLLREVSNVLAAFDKSVFD
ncbi:hypothetical protein CCR98_06210 [Stenotrophomonas sp. WZN-1]|uniref:colicin immunity domain-containing protein n=1 Tax=Stenotrophomonas sp. WZN-1 TaxID=2005046 RepID=UPI000B435244|nr:colicin immunity domain-containing protein [Stenotrophomonas sp. WZN-1]ARZ73780.1 hypothetical protein CCR98_06210 [Stenotrophomonas sp. WZN-1]